MMIEILSGRKRRPWKLICLGRGWHNNTKVLKCSWHSMRAPSIPWDTWVNYANRTILFLKTLIVVTISPAIKYFQGDQKYRRRGRWSRFGGDFSMLFFGFLKLNRYTLFLLFVKLESLSSVYQVAKHSFFQGKMHVIWAFGQQAEFYEPDQLKYHGRSNRCKQKVILNSTTKSKWILVNVICFKLKVDFSPIINLNICQFDLFQGYNSTGAGS